jgi:hypothetical protein
MLQPTEICIKVYLDSHNFLTGKMETLTSMVSITYACMVLHFLSNSKFATVKSEAIACAKRWWTEWWTRKKQSGKMEGQGGGESQGVADPKIPNLTWQKVTAKQKL